MNNFDTKKQWDNKILKFDQLKYNFNEWALSIAKTICSDIDNLEKMHLIASPFELSKIKKEFHNKCNEFYFMEMIDKFIEEYIPSLIGNKDYLIQRNPTYCILQTNILF